VDFAKPRPKNAFLERFKKEIKKISPGATISMANSSDPYQPLEKKLRLTRDSLKILKNISVRILLITKSCLILRDIDIIKDLPKIVICFSFTTLDKQLAKRLEPGAPEPKDRLKALSDLSRYVPTAARLDPLIWPLTTVDIAGTIRTLKNSGASQIITSTYKARPLNFNKMLQTFPEHSKLWKKIYIEEGKNMAGSLYLSENKRKELIQEVSSAGMSEGMLFSSCREDMSNLNTASCDGQHLFDKT